MEEVAISVQSNLTLRASVLPEGSAHESSEPKVHTGMVALGFSSPKKHLFNARSMVNWSSSGFRLFSPPHTH